MDCLCRQVNTIDQFQAGLGSITLPVPGADPGFQVRGGAFKIFVWGISCENSRFYAKKSRLQNLPPLTSNSKNKTVVSKLHCMSNLQFKFHFNPLSGYLGVAGCRILLHPAFNEKSKNHCTQLQCISSTLYSLSQSIAWLVRGVADCRNLTDERTDGRKDEQTHTKCLSNGRKNLITQLYILIHYK